MGGDSPDRFRATVLVWSGRTLTAHANDIPDYPDVRGGCWYERSTRSTQCPGAREPALALLAYRMSTAFRFLPGCSIRTGNDGGR
ncbi:hypothetical protein EVAR_89970_1 [Eumeta japonica]|uniref:Uncharacterized protein n=1 Tax=Eumeta variegata TaxID=151549 RepID=A0A4C2ACB0_EUMVA|nr:hypothetical protein EVAR_89970_1 [Eumeta japonica]